jgi:uncharacterized phage infection (PIP) family protein YhgE
MSDIWKDTGSTDFGDTHRADLGDQAASLAERARTRVAETMGSVKDKAAEVAEQQKQIGAEKVNEVAGAVRRAANDLERELPQAAGYIHRAADSIERASDALKQRSLDDLIGTVGQFARNQPVAFFGTAVLAGFALSRFLKSSAEPDAPGSRSRGS